MEPSVRVEGAIGLQVVGAARVLMRSVLALWDCDDPDAAGELMTSEIVSNAVRHAAGVLALQFEISVLESMVRVTVEDPASAPPVLRAHNVDASGGRGLLLVESLATRWGSNPTDRGKAVWFEFPVHRREHRA